MKVKKKLTLTVVMMVLLVFLAGMAVSCGKEGTQTGGVKIADITWISVNVWDADYSLDVEMKPTNKAVAGTLYTVTLYEKGTRKAVAVVSFTQPQINIGSTEVVHFPCSKEEFDAYGQLNTNNGRQSFYEHMYIDLRSIFSVTIEELE